MKGRLFLAIILWQFLLPGFACAHKVNLFAWYDDGRVFTESYFSDGAPCRSAGISVREEGGQVIAEGATDEEGLFSFPYQGAGSLKISLNAGDGHGARITFQLDKEKSVQTPPEGPSRVEKGVPEAGGFVDVQAVRRILGEEIAPLRESVDQIRKKMERPSLDKVVGGLGWIVGLAGAYLWGASRRTGKGKREL